MVRLSKIYTKTGDSGTTMLGDGSTVPKSALRVEAYGTVDEANATIGVAIAALGEALLRAGAHPDTQAFIDDLTAVQNDLFDVGADLCVPVKTDEQAGAKLRTTPAHVERLERQIDAHNEQLEALTSFVLPGGSMAAASLHLARTVVRRAERLVTHLRADDPDRVNQHALVYLNRLSDLLFVMARRMNDDGKGDVLWTPGGGSA